MTSEIDPHIFELIEWMINEIEGKTPINPKEFEEEEVELNKSEITLAVVTVTLAATEPIEQEQILIEQEKVPIEQEKIPIQQEKILIEQEQVPIEQEKVPIEQEQVPIEQEMVPIEQEQVLIEQEHKISRKPALRVRNVNVPVKAKEVEEEKPIGKRKLSDVLGMLNGPKRSKRSAASGVKRKIDENDEDEDKENAIPGQAKQVAKPTRSKLPRKKEETIETHVEVELKNEQPDQVETLTSSLDSKEIEVATFLAQKAALRKLNENITINNGQLISTTAMNTTTNVDANLDTSFASSPPLPIFTTTAMSNNILLNNVGSDVDEDPLSLLLKTNTTAITIDANMLQQTVNFLVRNSPHPYDKEYEIVSEQNGVTICRPIEKNEPNPVLTQEILATNNNGDDTKESELEAESNEPMDSIPKLPENYTPEKFEYNGHDLTSIEGNTLFLYTYNVAKVLFTLDELKTGYIAQENFGKTKRKKSNNKLPFDIERIQILRRAICLRFNINEDRLDMIWTKVRHSFHLRLAKIDQVIRRKNSSVTENLS